MIMLIIGSSIGFILGAFFVFLGQHELEKGYEREGIAKINGSFYKLTKLGKGEEL